MALFKETNNSLAQANQQSTFSSSTFIAKDIEVTGNFKGKGSLQVEGTVNGDINVNSVVIGESGILNGNVEAKNIIVNGKLNGSVKCNSLEVMKHGSISNKTLVKSLQVAGSIEGEIIVSELLEIFSTGSVVGEIAVNQIITHEGGKIIGSMKIYKED
jgi:cytoskeletal protein CcmA (bactofilin family)